MNNKSYSDKAQVATYVDFYIDNLAAITEAAQFIGLNDEQLSETQSALDGLKG